jgi:hypothetical protein
MTTETPQHLTALALANARRLERSTIKKAVAAKTLRLAPIIETVPDSCATAALGDALSWMPRVGADRARRILLSTSRELGGTPPSEGRRLTDLTARQRTAIARAVTAIEEEYVVDDLTLELDLDEAAA